MVAKKHESPSGVDAKWEQYIKEHQIKVRAYETKYNADLSFLESIFASEQPINFEVGKNQQLINAVFGNVKYNKKRYRDLCRIYHPDGAPEGNPQKIRQMTELCQLCQLLKDSAKAKQSNNDINLEDELNRFRNRARTAAGMHEEPKSPPPPKSPPRPESSRRPVEFNIITNQFGKPFAIKIRNLIFEIGDEELCIVDTNTSMFLEHLELVEIEPNRVILRDKDGTLYPIDFNTFELSNGYYKPAASRNSSDYQFDATNLNVKYDETRVKLASNQPMSLGLTRLVNTKGSIVLTTGVNNMLLVTITPDLATGKLYVVNPHNSADKIEIIEGKDNIFGKGRGAKFQTLGEDWVSPKHFSIRYSQKLDRILVTDLSMTYFPLANGTYVKVRY